MTQAVRQRSGLDTGPAPKTPGWPRRLTLVEPGPLACRFATEGRVFGHRGPLAAFDPAARVQGAFRFDPTVQGSVQGSAGPVDGAGRFDGAVLDLRGAIGSGTFHAPRGTVLVGRGLTLSQDEPRMDLLQLAAQPPGAALGREPWLPGLLGFSVPGFRLVNVRLFWVHDSPPGDGHAGLPDGQETLTLPRRPPPEAGRLALDFLTDDRDDGRLHHVFFDGLSVQAARRAASAEVAAAPATRRADRVDRTDRGDRADGPDRAERSGARRA